MKTQALKLGLAAGLSLCGGLALLGWGFEAWGNYRASRPVVSVGLAEDWPKPQTRGSARLAKGKVIVLDPGRPERWKALVERRQGSPQLRILKKLKRVSKGRPMQAMLGRSDKDDSVRVPKVTRAYATLKVEATAYDPGPDDNGPGNTALTVTGDRARFGVVAVDPLLIPYRSLLYIEGYGPGLALDKGGAIKGRRVDLCFNSTREAEDFGRRKTKVHLLSGLEKGEREKVLEMLGMGL